ncbi:MAG: phosphomannomutase/phosphoglucomutase, partial [Pseudomonadaceae bacterium]|nr:phosphomannomutase/phosphoglucomutase [Pseudomonadaceae bacterium]
MKLKTPSLRRQPRNLPDTLVPLLLMLAGLAAALALLWLLVFAPAAERYRQGLSQAYVSQQQSGLNRTLARLDADLTQLAASPRLQTSLQRGDEARQAQLLRELLGDALAVHVHLPGRADLVEDASAPVNFAALDMIRRAERGQAVPAEAQQVGSAWLLYMVKPLRSSPQAPVAGTLLAIFDLQRLTGALPQLPSDAGQVRLIQQFPSGPEQILYHTGHGQGTEVRLNTDNPHWKISFQDGQAMAAGAPNPLWLAGAILLALAGALASLLYLQRIWERALAADAETLEQLTRGHKAAGLALG